MSEATPSSQASDNPLFVSDLQDQQESLDFVAYWHTLRRRKWAILAFALVVTLLAGAFAYVSTPIYEATTTLMIETNKQKVVTIEDVYGGVGASREYFQTQVEIIKSREVSLKAIAKLKLYDNPEFDPRVPRKGLATWMEKIGFATKETPREWTEEALTEAALGKLAGNLTIEPVRLSQLVMVRFTSPNAALAAQISNAVAQTYIENDLEARYQMTRTATTWLQERLAGLKAKLDQSEQALQGYREKQSIVNIKDAAQNGAGQEIQLLQTRLIEAQTRRAEVEATYKIVKDAASAGDLASQPTVLNSLQVGDAKRQAAEAARKLADVSQRYGKEHPKYLQADSDAKAANDNLQRQIDLVVAGINHEYERAKSTEKMLLGALGAARGVVQNINRKEFELGIFERDVDSNRQMYDMVMKRIKETNVAGDLQTTVARVVDAAAVPTGPIKPKKTLIVAVALSMGLLIGMMVALLVDALDNTLRNTQDVASRLQQPLLAALPLLAKNEAMGHASGRLMMDAPNSRYSEAIRTARTEVLLPSVNLETPVLVVTSSVSAEGKTTFSSNLALALAQTQKTLLIDANMRHPGLTSVLGLDASAVGLSELLAGTALLDDCLQHKDSKLTIMSSGAIAPNPLELLLSERFGQTLELLRRRFETIVIDSPAVGLVSDALVLASQATGIIFVSKAHSTPLPLMRKTLLQLRRANGHMIGVVLNALDFNLAEKYYGEYPGHGQHGNANYRAVYGLAYGASAAKQPQSN